MRPPNDVNVVILSGQVTYVRVYDDGQRVVLILATPRGRFYVEYAPKGKACEDFQVGDQVMVKGCLYARRGREGFEMSRIGAEEVTKIRP